MVALLLPRRPVWLTPAVLALAACSSTGPGASRPVSLSVTTRSPAAAPTSSPASAAITVGSGANSVTLTKVQVVLARIELATNGPLLPRPGKGNRKRTPAMSCRRDPPWWTYPLMARPG